MISSDVYSDYTIGSYQDLTSPQLNIGVHEYTLPCKDRFSPQSPIKWANEHMSQPASGMIFANIN